MSYGDGSITELKKDGASFSPKKWRVRVYAGEDPATGRKKWASRTVRGTKADARKARDELKRELESGLKVDARNVTFGEFAHEWYQARLSSGALAAGYAADVRGIVRCLCEAAGSVRLRSFDARTVEAMYEAVRAAKREAGHPVSNTRMRKYHQVAHQIFSKAVSFGLIVRNPVDAVEAPKVDEVNRRSLSAEEGARLLAAIDGEEAALLRGFEEKERRQHDRENDAARSCIRGLSCISRIIAVRIGLATGARLGEVLALSWGEVDLKAGSIRIVRSVTPRNEVKQPKSRAGVRSLSIDAATVEHLKRWKRMQRAALESLGVVQRPETPVCCSDVGTLYRMPNFENWWRRWREAAGFPGLKFHELRHTQATQLLAAGVDVKTVQTRLGHSNAALTLNQYAHAIPEKDRECAEIIGALLHAGRHGTPPENSGFRLVKTA